jgi:serine-type D-Ala-D-Ala carboxypeptidase (penicillin-binding protein 5/6)
MMQTGNDAATALAEHVGGSVEGFVYLMNEKAEMYNLTQTHFTNPTGLHHNEHVSSAYDTAKMLQIAMQNETFQKIASTKVFSQGMTWKNKHRLLHEDVGAIAGKTGYTKVASRTLATFFKREHKSFIVVTLNEGNDWHIHKLLADYVETHFEHEIIVKKGTYQTNGVTVYVDRPIELLMKKGEKSAFQHILVVSRHPDSKRAAWRIYDDNGLVMSKLITFNAR